MGKEYHEHREFSDETARIIDQEVQNFLTKAAETTRETLQDQRAKLDELVEALLDKEIL